MTSDDPFPSAQRDYWETLDSIEVPFETFAHWKATMHSFFRLTFIGLLIGCQHDFFCPSSATALAVDDTNQAAAAAPNVESNRVHLRGSLLNCLHRFEHDKEGHVVFLGGSITEMAGYRPRVEAWLTARFPETKFTFTNAGISSTCSHTGAFRLDRDVLSKGPVDLLLVEFAVNDDQDAHHSADDCIRGMEGIIRHVSRHNSKSDIVMIHFVNPEMLATAQSGSMHLSAAQHEAVAKHYNVSSIDLPGEVSDRVTAGTLTWEQFGGTHPGPIGNQLATDLVAELLTAGWKAAPADAAPRHSLTPLLKSSFEHGQFLSHDAVTIGDGWTRGIPDWKSIAGSQRERFNQEEMIFSTQPGAALTLKFTGTAVGAFVLAGPDAGQLMVQIDGGDWKTVELYHSYSAGLHYPRTVMFASDLPDGPHEVRVQVSQEHHAKSKDHAARVLAFVANF